MHTCNVVAISHVRWHRSSQGHFELMWALAHVVELSLIPLWRYREWRDLVITGTLDEAIAACLEHPDVSRPPREVEPELPPIGTDAFSVPVAVAAAACIVIWNHDLTSAATWGVGWGAQIMLRAVYTGQLAPHIPPVHPCRRMKGTITAIVSHLQRPKVIVGRLVKPGVCGAMCESLLAACQAHFVFCFLLVSVLSTGGRGRGAPRVPRHEAYDGRWVLQPRDGQNVAVQPTGLLVPPIPCLMLVPPLCAHAVLVCVDQSITSARMRPTNIVSLRQPWNQWHWVPLGTVRCSRCHWLSWWITCVLNPACLGMKCKVLDSRSTRRHMWLDTIPLAFVVSAVLYRHGFAKRIEVADSEPEQLNLATLMQAQDAEIDRRIAAGLDFRYGASMMQLVTCQMLPLTMLPCGLPAARIAW